MSKFGMSSFAGLIMICAGACNNGIADTAQNAGKCEHICTAVDDCTGNTDVSACRKECTTRSEDSGFEKKAASCSACVDTGDKCSTNIINCAAECTGVVVLSTK